MKKLLSVLAIGVMVTGTTNSLFACSTSPKPPIKGTQPDVNQKNLQEVIGQEKRNLGVVVKLNDTLSEAEKTTLVTAKVYHSFPMLFDEVTLFINLEHQTILVRSNLGSFKFFDEVLLNYSHDQNPKVLPEINGRVELGTLKTNRFTFEQLDVDQKEALIREPLKNWYLSARGLDFAIKYFQYFKIETRNLTGDSTSTQVQFQSPWEALNQEFEVKFRIPYATITDVVPTNLFVEKILDMDAHTTDEEVGDALMRVANQKVPNFSVDFELTSLDVVHQTVMVTAKTKTKHQIYEPGATMVVEFNVGKADINTLFGSKLRDYKFDANSHGLYYLAWKELVLSTMKIDISSKLATNEKDLVTLNNEFNDRNFDTTDPDKWVLKLTPAPQAARYLTGEIQVKYTNPKASGLNTPISQTYDTPGRNQL